MTAYPIFDGALELRQSGGARTLHGRFNYNSMATIRDRGRVRKEKFEPRAFRFAIDQEPDRRIDLLVGHDYGKPLASRQAGTLNIEDGTDAVTFEARLPDDPPSCVNGGGKNVPAIRSDVSNVLRAGWELVPRSPWEGPACGATRPPRGWRRPARGRGLSGPRGRSGALFGRLPAS